MTATETLENVSKLEFIDTYSSKVEGLLMRRSYYLDSDRACILELTSTFCDNGEREYRITVPGRFGNETIGHGTLDEMMAIFEDVIKEKIKEYDPEKEAKKKQDYEFFSQSFYRVVGGGKYKKPSRY